MKRMGLLAAGGLLMLAGCGDGGIEFNGQKQVVQFPVRQTPIFHYNLPAEGDPHPVTGIRPLEVSLLPTDPTAFVEHPMPGHDQWAMLIFGVKSDSPPAAAEDWSYTHDVLKPPGAGWPHPSVSTSGPGSQPANVYIAAWVLSLQNQWFLKDVNGNDIVPTVVGEPPVRYESLSFSSMKISIHEASFASSLSALLNAAPPIATQQETGDPASVGDNGVQRTPPVNNYMSYAYNGNGAPAGLLAVGWREPPGRNIHIENSVSTYPNGNLAVLQSVPVPVYFGGGGPIACGGGVFMARYSVGWQQLFDNSPEINDGVTYSYYLATVGNHLIGYGVGLVDSAFALPGVSDDQEDIMNISVVFDMTAFIGAGKKFQFVAEDLMRMQDVANGDFNTPGPLSTLPGSDRKP